MIGSAVAPPVVTCVIDSGAKFQITAAIAIAESTPVTIRPWYRAAMMLRLLPSRTAKVPRIEVTMQTAQIASGSSIIVPTSGSPRKKMAASTIVATVVTA